MKSTDITKLKKWFVEEKRDLPWRQMSTPYAVWVSEVMLQQTQVSVVVPYFDRWMKRFPTIHSLANAPLDEVIKVWEGLGYYSRARNLHQGAKQVLDQFNGVLPSEESDLKTIKGLGPYTIGAIRSFAFHARCPAVDGNVMRVLCRYYALEDDIAKAKTQAALRQTAMDLLPENEPWVINEALIELGATVCSKKPSCQQCPLKSGCKSYSQGNQLKFPYKSTKYKTEKLYRAVAVIHWQDEYLIRRGKEGEIMSDLHEFPYLEVNKEGIAVEDLKEMFFKSFGLDLAFKATLPPVKHSFTRYEVRLDPWIAESEKKSQVTGYEWIVKEKLKHLAFSSGHRRILKLMTF